MKKFIGHIIENKILESTISNLHHSAEINNNSLDDSTLKMDIATQKQIKKIVIFLAIIFTTFYVLSFFVMDGIISFCVISLLYLSLLFLSLYLINKTYSELKIIENKIYKSSFLKKEKFICNLDDIATYCELGNGEIEIMDKNNKVLFVVPIYWNSDKLREFLKKASAKATISKGIDPLAYISLLFAFSCSYLPFLQTNSITDIFLSIGIILFFLLWGINEKIKYIYVTTSLITVKTIFGTKTYKYSDFNKIIYRRNSKDAIFIIWKIKAYNNKKLVFSYSHISNLAFEKMLKYFSKNDIELIEKKRFL